MSAKAKRLRKHLSVARDGVVHYGGSPTGFLVARNENEPATSPNAWTLHKVVGLTLLAEARTRGELLDNIAERFAGTRPVFVVD